MKTFKTLPIVAALAGAFAQMSRKRARTQDNNSFTYRMGAGFPGDVNRTHPASILPGLMDATSPIGLYGDPCLIDGTSHNYRAFIAGDGSATPTKLAGVLVRPYPTQQQSGGMTSTIGTGSPPTGTPATPIDVLTMGYIMAKCNNFGVNAPVKGGAVFVWCAASSGAHVQGGFEAAANSTNTVPVTNAFWNGPTDANGVTEISVGMLQL